MKHFTRLTLSAATVVTLLFTSCSKSGSGGGTTVTPDDPKYIKKVLVEDFTGTWCGWCPLMSYALEQQTTNPNVIFSGLHDRAGASDPYHSGLTTSLRGSFGINAFPTALVNRKQQADDASLAAFITAASGQKSHVGIQLETVFNGSSLDVKCSAAFSTDLTGSTLRIACYLVEDSLYASQANYLSGNASYSGHPYFSKPNPIPGYLHRYVLRTAGDGVITGQTIPAASTAKGGIYVKNFSFNLTGTSYVQSNLRVIALVTKDSEGCANVQWVKAGSSQLFQ